MSIHPPVSHPDNQICFCIFCGTQNPASGTYCQSCGKELHPKEHLTLDYLKKEAKSQIRDKITDSILEKIRKWLLSHLFGILLSVSVIFAAGSAFLPVSSIPRQAEIISEAPLSDLAGLLIDPNVPVFTATPHPTSTPLPTPTALPDPYPVDIRFTYRSEGPDNEYAYIAAYDLTDPNRIVWEYFSEHYSQMQLDHCAELGRFIDQYYYQEDDSVVCLDAKTGRVLFRIHVQTEGSKGAFDEQGNLYIIGFFSGVHMISPDGYLVRSFDNFGSLMWPYSIEVRDRTLVINFSAAEYGEDGKDHYFYLDLDSWTGTT